MLVTGCLLGMWIPLVRGPPRIAMGRTLVRLAREGLPGFALKVGGFMTEEGSFLAEIWLPSPSMIIGGLLIASGAANKGFGFAKNGVLLLGMLRLGTLYTF